MDNVAFTTFPQDSERDYALTVLNHAADFPGLWTEIITHDWTDALTAGTNPYRAFRDLLGESGT